jgi:hypothetical protein
MDSARKTPRPNSRARALLAQAIAALLSFSLVGSGCLSTKYKMAPKDTPAPLPFNLAVTQPPVALALHTVIVIKGPGSWKKEAYWDEYVVSILNQGAQPLVVSSAGLVDVLGTEQAVGTDPWTLEKISRENLKQYEHVGRKILLGAGLTAAWAISLPLGYAAAWGGSTALAVVAASAFFLIPVFAVGSGVRYFSARSSIKDEFNRRRITTPLTLQAGEMKKGSLFFPVCPGPQRLILHCRVGDEAKDINLDLTLLAGLHLLKEATSGPATPAAPPADAKP